ncbi:MAG: tryptophan synthase subunit alpha [Verrucomicrobiota bacterium JB022]|nr:tryptophan synthase subunit alpha [Verrucomicrobiota bacterium JB022]
MDRIADAFSRAKAEERTLFVSYLCAGDPDPQTSFEACRALIDNGVGLMELGVPFSDPLADGKTNQLAAQRALENEIRQSDIFALAKRVRGITDKPIIFYTYYNLVFANGVDAYVRQVKEAGVDGILVLDLPPEEAGEVLEACERHDVKTVFIVAPTTPTERLSIIAEATTGFIYYVSQEGVTGVRKSLAEDIGDKVAKIKEHIDLPVVVGFGISTPEQVKTVASVADGVVVGSALVNCIGDNLDHPEQGIAKLGAKARELVGGLSL